jgi:hypothetical protein
VKVVAGTPERERRGMNAVTKRAADAGRCRRRPLTTAPGSVMGDCPAGMVTSWEGFARQNVSEGNEATQEMREELSALRSRISDLLVRL